MRALREIQLPQKPNRKATKVCTAHESHDKPRVSRRKAISFSGKITCDEENLDNSKRESCVNLTETLDFVLKSPIKNLDNEKD